MAVDNLSGLTIQGVVGGLLLTCLLSFALAFMYYNNPTGLGDTSDILESTYQSANNQLTEVPTDANEVLNITSNTNPEVSDLGSRDSVATGYKSHRTAKENMEAAKDLFTWVFTGTAGKLLLGTLLGIIGLLGGFYIYKYIKQGN